MAPAEGRRAAADAHALEIAVDGARIPVSNLSSLLRVVQAAAREVARNAEASREAFSQQRQPALHVVIDSADDGQDEPGLSLRFGFSDPVDSTPMAELSQTVFEAFSEQLVELLKGLPQRGLWGQPAAGAQAGPYDSEVYRRLDQVRLEMRRFPRARLAFGRRLVSFEGDRMEITQAPLPQRAE